MKLLDSLIDFLPSLVTSCFKELEKALFNKDIGAFVISKADFELLFENKVLNGNFNRDVPKDQVDAFILFLKTPEIKQIINDIYVPNPSSDLSDLCEIRDYFCILFSEYFSLNIEESRVFALTLFDILVEGAQIVLSKAIDEKNISELDAKAQFRSDLLYTRLKILLDTKSKDYSDKFAVDKDTYNKFLGLTINQHKREIEIISAKYIKSLFVPRKRFITLFEQFLTSFHETREYNRSLPLKNKRIEEINEKVRIKNQKIMLEYPDKSKKELSEKGILEKETPILKEKQMKNCFFIMGEAGIGKTNLLCYLAEEYEKKYPVIFLNGSRIVLSKNQNIEHVITDYFNKISDIQFENALDSIEKVSSHEKKSVLVFIDAINECLNLDLMRIYLGNLLSYKKEKNILFLISCRDIDWRFFETENAINESIYQVENNDTKSGNTGLNYSSKPFMMEGYSKRSNNHIMINLLSEEEFTNAWVVYKKYFRLEGNVSKDIMNICRQPIMLRFFCEAYEGGKVPERDIKRIEIFNNYWEKKLAGTGEKRESQAFLFSIVKEMLTQKKAELIETEVEKVTKQKADKPRTTFSKVLSENIILYKERDGRTKEYKIGFTYEAFFEYVIARYFLNIYGNNDDEYLLQQFKQLLDAVQSFRNLMGAIEYIILLLEDETIQATDKEAYVEMIELLSMHNDKSFRTEAITIITKLKNVRKILDPLKILADDENNEINNSVYKIFMDNYKLFEANDQRDILDILSTKSNKEFLHTPLEFMIKYYNDLLPPVQQLLVSLSLCDFITTKRKLSQLLSLFKVVNNLPFNIYENIMINLSKENDKLIAGYILSSISNNIHLLNKKYINVIFSHLVVNESASHQELCKFIKENTTLISGSLIKEFIKFSITQEDLWKRLSIVVMMDNIFENKVVSIDDDYKSFIITLASDPDENISHVAKKCLAYSI